MEYCSTDDEIIHETEIETETEEEEEQVNKNKRKYNKMDKYDEKVICYKRKKFDNIRIIETILLDYVVNYFKHQISTMFTVLKYYTEDEFSIINNKKKSSRNIIFDVRSHPINIEIPIYLYTMFKNYLFENEKNKSIFENSLINELNEDYGKFDSITIKESLIIEFKFKQK